MLFDFKNCGGCKTCQLACSYKLKGSFNYHDSAIEVIEKEDKCGYFVRLNGSNDGMLNICDGCKGLDEPLCIKYCHERDQLLDYINDFLLSEKNG